MLRMNFPRRKEKRRQEALERNAKTKPERRAAYHKHRFKKEKEELINAKSSTK